MNRDPKFNKMWRDYVGNQLSGADMGKFMQLVREGHHDEAIKEEIDRLLASEETQLELSPQQAQEVLINIQLLERQTSRLISFRTPSRKIWYWSAAACAFAVLVGTIWLFLRNKPAPPAMLVNTATVTSDAVAKTSGKRFIRLPDASFVILNENSELDYPDDFTGKIREVTLRGEAYFDIKHLPSKPFIVHTGNINTVVLGTAFNINAFPGQHRVTITVTRGKVAVRNSKKTLAVVAPNQQLSINTEDNKYSELPVDAEAVVAWKSLCLVLSDVTMEDAALLIGNKYHVKITISDEKLKQCRINATFLDQESLDQVLAVICGIVNASFVQQPNDQIIISRGNNP